MHFTSNVVLSPDDAAQAILNGRANGGALHFAEMREAQLHVELFRRHAQRFGATMRAQSAVEQVAQLAKAAEASASIPRRFAQVQGPSGDPPRNISKRRRRLWRQQAALLQWWRGRCVAKVAMHFAAAQQYGKAAEAWQAMEVSGE